MRSVTSEPPKPSSQSHEQRLVNHARRGNRQAFFELYHRHVGAIYRYIHSRVGDMAVAEDLTAQVFAAALAGLQDIRSSQMPFLVWLYRLARAEIDVHCQSKGAGKEAPHYPVPSPSRGQAPSAEAELCAAVSPFAKLTADQQDVLFLRLIGQLPVSDIAAALDKSVGTVKALQSQALASLARMQEASTGSPPRNPAF